MDENQINWIEDLKKVNLKCGDVLVLKTIKSPTNAQLEAIQKIFLRVFPDNKVIVLEPGMELGVISGEVDKKEGSNNA